MKSQVVCRGALVVMVLASSVSCGGCGDDDDSGGSKYKIGGRVVGLADGNRLVLQNNQGDDLEVTRVGTFTFPTELDDGASYKVTVRTQPTAPSQQCLVTGGQGTVRGADVTGVTITCLDGGYSVGGTITGLAPGNSVVLQNNFKDDLTVTENGRFTFATGMRRGDTYRVTVLTQPTTPTQTCAITGGTGTVATTNVTRVAINCTIANYSVGGTLSGLATGNSLVLQNNGANDLLLRANANFIFPSAVKDGDPYNVTVLTQPTSPDQTCTITGGSGIIDGASVTMAVTCTTHTFTVGGSVSGLGEGQSVVLQNNLKDDLTLSANGTFTFATPIDDGSPFSVTVLTHPSGPNKTCVVTQGAGTIASGNVTNVTVTCEISQYTVGGTVTGLAYENTLVVQNNGGEDFTITANGPYAFPTTYRENATYNVTILTQPTSPGQVCTLVNGSGTITNSSITHADITCVTQTYTVGGTITGLAPGNDVVLQNNLADDLTVSTNGSFAFATPMDDGAVFAVTVLRHPTSPNQTCILNEESGTVNGDNVTTIRVDCMTNRYTIGGTVTGLGSGNQVVLQNNGGDDLAVGTNGLFTFITPIEDGAPYNVTVLTQPTGLDQTCLVTNGSAVVAGFNVYNVRVSCGAAKYTIGGTVTGLADGSTMVLQNNGGDDLTVNTNGVFTFDTPLEYNDPYSVTVLTQPTTPNQTCIVSRGSGQATTPVTDIEVTCTTVTFSIGGTVAGLAEDNSVVLQNNDGNDLIVRANGSFTFTTPIADGTDYRVTVLTHPTTPNQTCAILGGEGTVAGAPVTTVQVTCITNTYTIGGSLTGLATGATVVLQNNLSETLTVTENGPFMFEIEMEDGGPYDVTVVEHPTVPLQTCTVRNGSGVVAGGKVEDVEVTCTHAHHVGGTVVGLGADQSVVLRNNGKDDLTVTANGVFTFEGLGEEGGPYNVTVLTYPTAPDLVCQVDRGSGVVGSGDVTDVLVRCQPPGHQPLAAGDTFACSVRTDGSITCWGYNAFGKATPPADTGFVSVGAGRNHGCGLKQDGSLLCWDTHAGSTPTTHEFTSLAAGAVHTCAVTRGGTLQCWGTSTVAPPPTDTTFVAVAAGDRYSCALKQDGSIVCWGQNTYGQTNAPTDKVFTALSAGSQSACALKQDGALQCWGRNDKGQTNAPADTGFTAVATGFNHACALKADGSIACWGANEHGEGLPTGSGYTALTAGVGLTCARKPDASTVCWGNNNLGQATPPQGNPFEQVSAGSFPCALREDGSISCLAVGVAIPGTGFQAVSAGTDYACALGADGSIVCQGRATHGQLTAPVGTGFLAVAAARFSACALQADGAPVCWGMAYSTPPPSDTGFTALSSSEGHGCALRLDGSIACWGDNFMDEATPPEETGFVSVSAGKNLSCARKLDGSLACWGSNTFGESTPPEGAGYLDVSAGTGYACAVAQDHSLECWGSSAGGFTTPPPGTDYVKVSAGSMQACALTQSGALHCWGLLPVVNPG